ncbi:MAG: asparagine synthetase B [Gemmatimonadales bacterium]|nr:MAG: asparagine synthetase B [Gemmatimonadales bacterium]
MAGVLLWCLPNPGELRAQHLLVPMDDVQANHLKAYGVTYRTIAEGQDAEWLLNHRGGSFLLPDTESIRRELALEGVTSEPLDPSGLQSVRDAMEAARTDAIPLESTPRIAVYAPPGTPPWDDAVTLALEYAGVPYERIWDGEVIRDGLEAWDWVHLHHEDFTGQYSKFYLTYAGSDWMMEEVERNEAMAAELGFSDVPALKRAVAVEIRDFVEAGGFLFAMCTATETLDLALASHSTDIAASYANGRPPDPDASERMDWSRALAFRDARVETSASVTAFSDIDSHQVNTPARQALGSFTLMEFSSRVDPVAAMLVQNHVSVIDDFYGQTTAFRADRLRPDAVVLAREGDWVKYVTGELGEGVWTFYGGHDPEDPEHQVGDAPTNLDRFPNSPGYRLILNNILFPAARPEPLPT